jgi:hypothetical protein
MLARIDAETRLQFSECLESRKRLLTRHAPTWRPSTTDSPLCAWRTDPLTAADELPKNHRPGSTFARIFEGPIDPRKGTKGRRIDGSELGYGSKAPFFKLPRDGEGHISSADFKGEAFA